jgi:hypothetical protein
VGTGKKGRVPNTQATSKTKPCWAEGQGATSKDTFTSKTGSPTGMEPGTGVEDSVQGGGATNQQGVTLIGQP